MTIPEPLAAAIFGMLGVVLAALLADIGIWRRSLHKDLRRIYERLAVVETTIHYISPAAHRRAKREVQNDE